MDKTIAEPLALWLRRPLIDDASWHHRLRLYGLFLLLVALSSPPLHAYADITLSHGELAVHTLLVTAAAALLLALMETVTAALRHLTERENRVTNGGLLVRAAAAYLLAIPVVGLLHLASPFTRGIMAQHARATELNMSWFVLPVALLITYMWFQAARKTYLSRQLAKLRRINDELRRAPRSRRGDGERRDAGRQPPAPAIAVRSNGVDIALPAESILRIQSDENYCHIVAATGDGGAARHMVRMTLKEAAGRLPERMFVQVHRSHLVNIRCVTELMRDGHRRALCLTNGDRVPVSRARMAVVQARIGELLSAGGGPANPTITDPGGRVDDTMPAPRPHSQTGGPAWR